MKIKKFLSLCAFLFLNIIIVSSCGGDVSVETPNETESNALDAVVESPGYYYAMITQEQAKQLMDTQNNYVILDVRTEEEYNEGHIPGAILIPDYEIVERAEKELVDKNQLILVYCRSGRRSKLAAERLAWLGYKNVKEFGGIMDWPYEVE